MAYNAELNNVNPDGLNASLARALGIDLKCALMDPQFSELTTEMTEGCTEHNCTVVCAKAILEGGHMSEPPPFCPNRHLLKLLQQKFPFDKPTPYADPFARDRVHVAPITRLDDPSIDDRD